LDHEPHAMRETRETVNTAMDQVIPHVMGDIASGRAEEGIFIHKKIHNVNKEIKYHAAAGDSAVHRVTAWFDERLRTSG